VIERSLAEGYKPFWICDKANVGSRSLAERLGFHHTGDIDLVDIPFEPYGFYASLAQRFFLPNGEYKQAAEAYERAFSVREGDAADCFDAARAWALAGERDKALEYLRKAIECGWHDMERVASEQAFAALRGTKKSEGLE
jgi:tetratricopeptide (TPR) repeat protein